MRVLVVDDDPTIRTLLTGQLEAAGHEVEVADDAAAAYAALEERRPDAMVLDVMMPDVSGWDALVTLRADDRYRTLPIVVLSARDVNDDVRRGYEVGASLVLSKPYDGDALVSMLESLVASAGSR